MRPSAKTFLKDILIMIPLLYLIIYAKDKLIFISFKDFVVEKCDTPLSCYSDICIYLMKFLSREIGVLHCTRCVCCIGGDDLGGDLVPHESR